MHHAERSSVIVCVSRSVRSPLPLRRTEPREGKENTQPHKNTMSSNARWPGTKAKQLLTLLAGAATRMHGTPGRFKGERKPSNKNILRTGGRSNKHAVMSKAAVQLFDAVDENARFREGSPRSEPPRGAHTAHTGNAPKWTGGARQRLGSKKKEGGRGRAKNAVWRSREEKRGGRERRMRLTGAWRRGHGMARLAGGH